MADRERVRPDPQPSIVSRCVEWNENRVNLTVEEVVKAVEVQGATDVRTIDLRGKGAGMGDYMVFCTGKTPLHMRRLANMIVQAVREREESGTESFVRAKNWLGRVSERIL